MPHTKGLKNDTKYQILIIITIISRMYALRRTRDAFKENKSITDGTLLQKSILEAKENLEIIRRQVRQFFSKIDSKTLLNEA